MGLDGRRVNRGLHMRWSIEGQTAEYLAATRMISLSDRIVETILAHVPLEAGMKVLDVGSGSGEYCFRLGSQVRGVSFTGLELDERFVEFAERRARGEVGYPFEEPNGANRYRFIAGDGCALPFDDGAFDAVVSHTFLTAVPGWRAAIAEMRRVCKPGGIVSSITSLTDDFYGTGTIELFTAPLGAEDARLAARIGEAKAAAFGELDLTAGIAPRAVPAAFDQAGLEGVRCVPLGQYFSLSDATTDEATYRRYVDLLRVTEEEQLARLALSIPEADRLAYARLIDRRCDELLSQIGANREWSWYGNAALLVCGTVAGR